MNTREKQRTFTSAAAHSAERYASFQDDSAPRMRLAGATDVFVLEVAQQLDLAQDALGIDQIVERLRNLLNRNLQHNNERRQQRSTRT